MLTVIHNPGDVGVFDALDMIFNDYGFDTTLKEFTTDSSSLLQG
jgi:hypothetical protein